MNFLNKKLNQKNKTKKKIKMIGKFYKRNKVNL